MNDDLHTQYDGEINSLKEDQFNLDFSKPGLGRNESHGRFDQTANVAQRFKTLMRQCWGWNDLTNVQREALEMDMTKTARILCGNQNEIDHWRDKAGYSQLVMESMKK